MRIRTASRAHYDAGPNLTPLVDVVLVVLIFLMLAGSFGGKSHFLKSLFTMPGAGHHIADPFKVSLDLYISDANAGVRSGGNTFRGVGIEPTSDVSFLARQLSSRRVEFDAAGSASEVQVMIHPGARVRYERIMQAYDAALRAGFSKVAFASNVHRGTR